MAKPKATAAERKTKAQRLTDAYTFHLANSSVPVAQVAQDFSVARSTHKGRIAGALTHQKAHKRQQRFSPAEEHELAQWNANYDDLGFSPKERWVEDLANILLEAKGDDKPLGNKWIYRFHQKHKNVVTMGLSTRMDRQRILQTQPAVVTDFFRKYSAMCAEHEYPLSHIINFDKKGFLMGQAANAVVFCRTNRAHRRMLQDGPHAFATMLETGFGDCSSMAPFAIFKGKIMTVGLAKTLRDLIPGANYGFSDNGWIDNDLAM